MKRREFLKIMAALGAVPSLGTLKPAPVPDPGPYLGNIWSADFYVSDFANISPGFESDLYFREHRKWIDREIVRACGLPPEVAQA